MQPDPTPPLDLDANEVWPEDSPHRWPIALDALRERYSRSLPVERIDRGVARNDIQHLIREVTALRAELDAARAKALADVQMALTNADYLLEVIDGVARWAKSEGYELTAAQLAARASINVDSSSINARAERTEPATGEDVETLSLVVEALRALKLRGPEPALPYNDFALTIIAERILAALQEAQRRLSDYEKWLRDWEDACPEDVCVESDGPQSLRVWAAAVVEERDAANAALADVAALLDEARTLHVRAEAEREWWKDKVQRFEAGVAEHQTVCDLFGCHLSDDLVEVFSARQHAGGEGGAVGDA